MNEDTEKTYTVEGMTCAHCVLSVREEVSQVTGVSALDVDLESGRLTVRGQGMADAAVRNAVAEAGYRVRP
jgi:copper chaperone